MGYQYSSGSTSGLFVITLWNKIVPKLEDLLARGFENTGGERYENTGVQCGVHAETHRSRDAKVRRRKIRQCGNGEVREYGDEVFQLDSAPSKTCTAGIPSGILLSFDAAASPAY